MVFNVSEPQAINIVAQFKLCKNVKEVFSKNKWYDFCSNFYLEIERLMAIKIKNSNDNLVFHKIDRQTPHCEVLFDFFHRRSEKYHISGKKNLTYDEHKKFVERHPYRYWLLVEFDGRYVGTLYVSYLNSIGVFLIDEVVDLLPEVIKFIKENYRPLSEIPSKRQKEFTINVSPENTRFIDILNSEGFKLKQKTFTI